MDSVNTGTFLLKNGEQEEIIFNNVMVVFDNLCEYLTADYLRIWFLPFFSKYFIACIL